MLKKINTLLNIKNTDFAVFPPSNFKLLITPVVTLTAPSSLKSHGTKNHIFHLFGTRKYRLFVSFQHTRKHDIS